MKKIFSLLLGFVFAFSTVSFFSGCSTTEGNNSIVANTIENIFTSALTIASNIIASDGTQQLAISAVESYLSGVITDPEQLEIINQIITHIDLTSLILGSKVFLLSKFKIPY